MYRKFCSIIRVVCFVLCLFPFLVDSGFAVTILSPVSSKPILIQARRPLSTLIVKVSSAEELAILRVSTAQNRAGEDHVIDAFARYQKNGDIYVHYSLPLKKGGNTFVVNPGNQELKIRYKPVRTLLNVNFEDSAAYLFHRKVVIPKECDLCHSDKLPSDANIDVSRLQKNEDYSPVCFSCHRQLQSKNKWQHGPTANLYCMSCHRKGSGNTSITMLTGRVEEVCFECHVNKKKINSQKHIHGPVGTGDCTICHDPHGDAYEFQLWADGKKDLCVGCHGDKKNAGKKTMGFTPHGIVLGGGCVACHSPHASNNRFQLYKPINELCVSCHIGMANMEKGHPVGSHPLKGKPDPRRNGRELSCVSCHNPHGSNYQYLLIGDLLGGHVCSMCHNDNN